ncbi:Hypothetical Protein SiL_0303 [Sulfolobus islandicus LAL14/1]|uniref:Uncharacterized protein n=1 Tax=Saccharolobus islandicus LAL14/1 TaxID=1241935 RepID=M9U6K0_SACIS|nr:Hypothetical Protein SiL_0303 [Sulfolobus islandicus LAL14/1]
MSIPLNAKSKAVNKPLIPPPITVTVDLISIVMCYEPSIKNVDIGNSLIDISLVNFVF